MFNSWPYLFYFLFLFFISKLEIKHQLSFKDIRLCECLGFLFFFGLRGFVMSDASVYYLSFTHTENISQLVDGFQLDTYSFEPGFKLLERIVYLLTKNFFAFQFINSLIDFILLDIIFRRYVKYYALGFLCFFMLEGYMYEVNLLRNMKSILLFFISIPYIKEKNFIKFLLINILGMMFHISAVFYIPLYWILNKRFSKPFILLIIIAGVFIPLLKIKIFHFLPLDSWFSFLRFTSYIDNSNETYQVGFRLIERTLICIFILMNYNRDNEHRMRIFFNLYLLYFISFNILYEIPIFPTRVSGLFLPAAWIILPYIIVTLKGFSFSSKINSAFFYGLLIVTFATIHDTQKYSNIMFSDETFDKYIIRYERALMK